MRRRRRGAGAARPDRADDDARRRAVPARRRPPPPARRARRAGARRRRPVDDLCGEVAASTASLSQAGYNTTLDLRAGRSAGGRRAVRRTAARTSRPGGPARMAALGLLRVVAAAELTPARLVDEVVAALAAPPPPVPLDLGGRERSTEIVADLVAARRRSGGVVSGDWLAPVARGARDGAGTRCRGSSATTTPDGTTTRCGRCSTCSRTPASAVDVAAIPTRRLVLVRPPAGVRASPAGWCTCTSTAAPTSTTSRSGGKCEFGHVARSAPARPPTSAPAARGSRTASGGPIEPVFTPPWNRCSADTADAVLAAGHRVLSRDVSAGRLDRPGLAEVPVSIDWSSRASRHPGRPGRGDRRRRRAPADRSA